MIELYKLYPKLDKNYLDEIENYGKDILEYEEYQNNRIYFQHGMVSIYDHCVMVAIVSLKIVDAIKITIDRKSLVRCALLHDYFKYDWHTYTKDKGLHKLHGFHHATIAANNAKKDFNVSDLEYKAIKSHMWPLGICFPTSSIAWILFFADKQSALIETLTMRK